MEHSGRAPSVGVKLVPFHAFVDGLGQRDGLLLRCRLVRYYDQTAQPRIHARSRLQRYGRAFALSGAFVAGIATTIVAFSTTIFWLLGWDHRAPHKQSDSQLASPLSECSASGR